MTSNLVFCLVTILISHIKHTIGLISSNITITSTNDNILTTVTDTCINDTHAIHDANTVYCANPPIKELVKYNGAIYECAWWTTGETPGIDFAWVLIKQCLIYTDSFFKASIAPYGTVKMFQDYVLDIDINLNPGYDLTRVSVAVDNNIYHYYNFNNLSIFEDYDFIRNNQTNAAKLTIRFIEILYTTYTIEFSFKDVTIAPTQTPTITTINPSNSPTLSPTIPPSIAPSNAPSNIPTIAPSVTPSNAPTFSPTISPTISPSNAPSITPTLNPSIAPTTPPTIAPSIAPSLNPTNVPTISPSIAPSNAPTNPSQQPTKYPSYMPSQTPTISPTNPTVLPTKNPTKNPTIISESPTINPSHNPTKYPIIETTFESMESMDK
eukprot:56548_1